MKKYYGTIEEKPVPEDIEAPPKGAVYVGLGVDVPTIDDCPYLMMRYTKWCSALPWSGSYGNAHYALPADSPYLKHKSPWITDRLPTAEDTDEGELTGSAYVIAPFDDNTPGWVEYTARDIELGDPWAPYPKMPPYVSPEETAVATAETVEERLDRLEAIVLKGESDE